MQKTDAGLGSLDLRALRLLGSILETRSVTRTAEAFGLSQPAASRALEQLRRALGDRLVVRVSTGGALTPRAQALMPLVQDAIEAVGRVFAAQTFDPATAEAVVRFATTDYGAAVVLAPLAGHLARAAPGVAIDVVPWSADTLAGLEQGRLSFALYADSDLPNDFHTRDLFEEGYSCLLRSGHPALARLAEGESTAAEVLGDYARAVMMFPDGRRTLVDDVMSRLTGTPDGRATLRTPYFLSGPLALQHSDLVMCVPSRAAGLLARMGGLACIALPEAAGFTYRLVWHERSHTDSLHVWMRKVVSRLERGHHGQFDKA